MLIRSQDKKRLTPINMGYLAVEKFGGKFVIFLNSGYLEDAWWNLGEYSTESKAIKVLDMIQKEYKKVLYGPGGKDAFTGETIQPIAFDPPKVFEMPLDEEVEE